MKLMSRNLKSIWYCPYQSKEAVVDTDNNETGEQRIVYGTPVEMKVNVSPAVGRAQQEQFGTLESYDKVVVTDDMNCPIDENTVMFIDRMPEFEPASTSGTFSTTSSATVLVNVPDYIVKRVAKSLTHISYGVTKVNVDD